MNTTDWAQVGTVEILRLRLYALDPNAPCGSDVAVEPGVYPLYRKGDTYQWIMRGHLNERVEKLGDGLFAMHGGDKPTGLEVQFPSRTFGPEEFAELLKEPTCKPGPEQRLRFEVTA